MEISDIPIEKIDFSPDQPREGPNQETIEGIMASGKYLKTDPILFPISVVKKENRYQIAGGGEQRLRAAQNMNLPTIPCIIRQPDEHDRYLESIIENEIRGGLKPIEKANAYIRAREKYGLTQAELGQILGKTKDAIYLIEKAGDVKVEGLRLEDHALLAQLARFPNKEEQEAIAKRLDEVPSRKAYELLAAYKKSSPIVKDALIKSESRLRPELATRISQLPEDEQQAVIEEIEEQAKIEDEIEEHIATPEVSSDAKNHPRTTYVDPAKDHIIKIRRIAQDLYLWCLWDSIKEYPDNYQQAAIETMRRIRDHIENELAKAAKEAN